MAKLNVNAPFVGLNDYLDDSVLGVKDAKTCINIDLSQGTLRPRPESDREIETTSLVLGMKQFSFENATSNTRTIVVDGTDLKKYDVDAQNVPVVLEAGIGSGLRPATFAMVGKRCYIADGSMFKVTDGDSGVHDPQLPRPAAPTVAVSATDGELDGDYDYKITFYSATWGQESPASDASAAVTANSKRIDLSSIATTTDARLDTGGKVRVYRRKISDGGTVWYYVGEVDEGTTVFVDFVRDEDVNFSRPAPLSFDETLPTMSYVAYHQGVLFAAELRTNKLYFSLPGRAFVIDGFLPIGNDEGDNEPITAIKSYQGSLYIGKSESIWVVTGNDRDSFSVSRIVGSTGIKSHTSVVEAGGLLYFLGRHGFYAFDGTSTPQDVSEPIHDYLNDPYASGDSRDPGNDESVVAEHFEALRAIVVSFPREISGRVFVYFYGNSQRAGRSSWSEWEFRDVLGQKESIRSIAVYSRDGIEELWIGMWSGLIEKITNLDNRNVDAFWKSPELDLGEPNRKKRISEVQFKGRKSPNSLVFCIVNDVPHVWDFSNPNVGTQKVFRTRHSGTNETVNFGVQFLKDSSGDVQMYAVQLNLSLVGRM